MTVTTSSFFFIYITLWSSVFITTYPQFDRVLKLGQKSFHHFPPFSHPICYIITTLNIFIPWYPHYFSIVRTIDQKTQPTLFQKNFTTTKNWPSIFFRTLVQWFSNQHLQQQLPQLIWLISSHIDTIIPFSFISHNIFAHLCSFALTPLQFIDITTTNKQLRITIPQY